MKDVTTQMNIERMGFFYFNLVILLKIKRMPNEKFKYHYNKRRKM
jgi:hypothetical protein